MSVDRLLKEAAAIELTLDAPSGPTEPIKPSFGFHGECLIEQRNSKEAAAQFEQALSSMPNHRSSVPGVDRTRSSCTSQAGQ